MNNLSFDLNIKNLMGSMPSDVLKKQLEELQRLMGALKASGTAPMSAFGYGAAKFAGIEGIIPEREAEYIGTRAMPKYEKAETHGIFAQQMLEMSTTDKEAKNAQRESTRALKDLNEALKETAKAHKEYNRIVAEQRELRTEAIKGIAAGGTGLIGSIGRLDPFGAYQNIKGMYQGGKALMGGGVGDLEAAGMGVGAARLLPFIGLAAGAGLAVGAAGVAGVNTLAGEFDRGAAPAMNYMTILNSLRLLRDPGIPGTKGYNPLSGIETLPGMSTGMVAEEREINEVDASQWWNIHNTGRTITRPTGRMVQGTTSIMGEFGKGPEDYLRQLSTMAPYFSQGRSLSDMSRGDTSKFDPLIQVLNRLEVTTGTAAEQWAKSSGEMIKITGMTVGETTQKLQKQNLLMETMGIAPANRINVTDAQNTLMNRYRIMTGNPQEAMALKQSLGYEKFFLDPRIGAAIEPQIAGLVGSGLTNQRQFMINSLLGGLSVTEMLSPDVYQGKFLRNIGASAREMAGKSVIPPELIAMLLTNQNPASDQWAYMRYQMGMGPGVPKSTEKTQAQAEKEIKEASAKFAKEHPFISAAASGAAYAANVLSETSRFFSSQQIPPAAGKIKADQAKREAVDSASIASAFAKDAGANIAHALTAEFARGTINLVVKNMTIPHDSKISFEKETTKPDDGKAAKRGK